MPTQTYICPTHGAWEATLPICEDVPKVRMCLQLVKPALLTSVQEKKLCGKRSKWTPPRGISFTMK